jgi:hypothetical protein
MKYYLSAMIPSLMVGSSLTMMFKGMATFDSDLDRLSTGYDRKKEKLIPVLLGFGKFSQ